jgi:hypothetical protein
MPNLIKTANPPTTPNTRPASRATRRSKPATTYSPVTRLNTEKQNLGGMPTLAHSEASFFLQMESVSSLGRLGSATCHAGNAASG